GCSASDGPYPLVPAEHLFDVYDQWTPPFRYASAPAPAATVPGLSLTGALMLTSCVAPQRSDSDPLESGRLTPRCSGRHPSELGNALVSGVRYCGSARQLSRVAPLNSKAVRRRKDQQ